MRSLTITHLVVFSHLTAFEIAEITNKIRKNANINSTKMPVSSAKLLSAATAEAIARNKNIILYFSNLASLKNKLFREKHINTPSP